MDSLVNFIKNQVEKVEKVKTNFNFSYTKDDILFNSIQNIKKKDYNISPPAPPVSPASNVSSNNMNNIIEEVIEEVIKKDNLSDLQDSNYKKSLKK